jgi:hypothetical protein
MQREGPLLKNGKRTSERMDKHVKADPKRSMGPKQKLFTSGEASILFIYEGAKYIYTNKIFF